MGTRSPEPEWTVRHATDLRDHWWWRPGWAVGTRFYAWHLTFGDAAEFHDLVRAYQHELRAVDGLDLIPRRWLHLTMQGVGHINDVPPGLRDDCRALFVTSSDMYRPSR